MGLLDGPGGPGDEAAPTVVVINANAAARVRTPILDLLVYARGAEEIEVAQNPELAAKRKVYSAAAWSVETSTNAQAYRVEYDVNEGVDCRTEPCEGSKRVFVRISGSGVRSEVASAEVVYDATAPGIWGASVAYLAPLNNPLARPMAATHTTTISVVVEAMEVVVKQPRPSLVVAGAGRQMVFALTGSTAVGLSFEARPPRDFPTGRYVPMLVMEDLAGNRSELMLEDAPVFIDTKADVLTIAQDGISYIRAPVGNEQAEDLGDFIIPAGPAYFALGPAEGLQDGRLLDAETFSFSPGRPTAIRVWADEAGQRPISGLIRPEDDGSWPRIRLQLANVDAPHAYVSGIDEAGNESAPVRVRTSWFVASSAQPTDRRSPHRLTQMTSAGPPLTDRGAVDSENLGSPDGRIVRQRAERSWVERTLVLPPARDYAAMDYDSARQRVVLFGGLSGGTTQFRPLSDLWEWDGRNWAEPPPSAQRPNGSTFPALAYDSGRGRTVLFGGRPISQEIWEWDGQRWWNVTPMGESPPGRFLHALAYDSSRRRTVLFGGTDGNYSLDDTWEWDGTQWFFRTNEGPTGLDRIAMAYDSIRSRTVLLGGRSGGSVTDTWEWDGERWLLVDTSTTGPGPGATTLLNAAFDRSLNRLIVVGGRSNKETWEWDGSRWSQSSSAPEIPAAIAYDGFRHRVVLHARGTYERVDGQWLSVSSSTERPTAREGAAIAYDTIREETVLFGGFNILPPFERNDTWAWDGTAWRQLTPTTLSPTALVYPGLVFDRQRGLIVLFGGQNFVTPPASPWTWDGRDWHPVRTATTPAHPLGPSLVFDTVRETILLTTSRRDRTGTDVWALDGTDWTLLEAQSRTPPGRTWYATAFDEARGVLVLFAEPPVQAPADSATWEWDGTHWARIDALPSPPLRLYPSTTYDPLIQRVVLFGGRHPSSEVVFDDVWEWDGRTWVDATPASGGPPGRYYSSLAFDEARNELLLFGGQRPPGYLGDLWSRRPAGTPSIQLQASLPSDISDAAIQGVYIRAFCGGTYSPFRPDDVGAGLWGWVTGGSNNEPGAWRLLNTGDTGLDGGTMPIEYRGTADDARSLIGPERGLYVQCRPLGTSDAKLAEVSVDYLEVRVMYGEQ